VSHLGYGAANAGLEQVGPRSVAAVALLTALRMLPLLSIAPAPLFTWRALRG
jgi:hypothetical protein